MGEVLRPGPQRDRGAGPHAQDGQDHPQVCTPAAQAGAGRPHPACDQVCGGVGGVQSHRYIHVYGGGVLWNQSHSLAAVGRFTLRLCKYSTSQKKAPFLFRSVFLPVSTVPVRSVPYRSVHFRSNRLPRANSFSARHEFVCKFHCVRWRSIARLFSTTRSRDGFFLP